MSAAADITRLRDEQGRSPNSIDWERVLTINYRGYVDPGGVVIDVGAHNGMHSRRFRRYLKPERLILVEPIPELAHGLRREFHRDRRVEVVEVALSTEPRTTTFVVDDTAPGESGLRNRSLALGTTHSTREITVQVERLDDWAIEGDLRFVKIDVEGGELDVLLGAGSTVDRHRPIISLEFGVTTAGMFGRSAEDLRSFAASHDLTLLDLLGNDVSGDFAEVGSTYYWDFLLVPTERLPALSARRADVRRRALHSIENFNPTIERWKKRLRR